MILFFFSLLINNYFVLGGKGETHCVSLLYNRIQSYDLITATTTTTTTVTKEKQFSKQQRRRIFGLQAHAVMKLWVKATTAKPRRWQWLPSFVYVPYIFSSSSSITFFIFLCFVIIFHFISYCSTGYNAGWFGCW